MRATPRHRASPCAVAARPCLQVVVAAPGGSRTRRTRTRGLRCPARERGGQPGRHLVPPGTREHFASHPTRRPRTPRRYEPDRSATAPTSHGVPSIAEPSSFPARPRLRIHGGAPSRRSVAWADFMQFVSVGRARIPAGGRSGRASRERRGGRPGRITLRRASGTPVPEASRMRLQRAGPCSDRSAR